MCACWVPLRSTTAHWVACQAALCRQIRCTELKFLFLTLCLYFFPQQSCLFPLDECACVCVCVCKLPVDNINDSQFEFLLGNSTHWTSIFSSFVCGQHIHIYIYVHTCTHVKWPSKQFVMLNSYDNLMLLRWYAESEKGSRMQITTIINY